MYHLFHKSLTSGSDLLLCLCKLVLQLINSCGVENLQRRESLSNRCNLRVVLRKTLQGIEDEHHTEGGVGSSLISEGAEILIRILVCQIELLNE